MQVKVARRYWAVMPEEVREKANVSVGDELDVRCEDSKIILEKFETAWVVVAVG